MNIVHKDTKNDMIYSRLKRCCFKINLILFIQILFMFLLAAGTVYFAYTHRYELKGVLRSFTGRSTGHSCDRFMLIQNKNCYKGPIMSIIDDDGYHNFLDSGIADMYRAKGVRPSLAIVACRAENPTGITTSGDPYVAMSWAELKTLAADGFEILNHSYSHDRHTFPVFANATESKFKYEYEQSQSLFLKNGFNPKTIVYPWGNPSALGSDLARQYFDYGVLFKGTNTGHIELNSNFNNILITRNTGTTAAVIKHCIDTCVANNGWFVWGTHSFQSGPVPSLEVLTEIIDYAIARGVRIEPFERAMLLRKPASNRTFPGSSGIFVGDQ